MIDQLILLIKECFYSKFKIVPVGLESVEINKDSYRNEFKKDKSFDQVAANFFSINSYKMMDKKTTIQTKKKKRITTKILKIVVFPFFMILVIINEVIKMFGEEEEIVNNSKSDINNYYKKN